MQGTQAQDPVGDLLHRLTRRANEVADLDALLTMAVQDICTTLSWPAGVAFEGDGAVGDSAVGTPSDPGPDLRERAHDEGRPVWETSEETPPGGVAVVVPVPTESGPLVSLCFTAPAADRGLDPVLGTIGWQLGMVAQRQHDRRELERREAALQRSNQELERFAYVASHDLQEPLRKVVTACELLEQSHGDGLSEDGARYVSIAVDGARRMQRLIRDLLTYSRLTQTAGDADASADLGDIVAEVLDQLSMQVEEAGAVVEVEALPVVGLGADEARHVLSNLLSNAIKYHGDTAPHVRVTAGTTVEGMVEVSVCDDGIGIEPEYHERVFEVFRRLHARDEYSGTGIGLAIVKRIVEHHGGRIRVESPASGGTCFHVLLPAVDDT